MGRREIVPARRRENPAAVYLARLGPGSRRTMRQALDVVAGILTKGKGNAETVDWASLRYGHVAAVRTALAERYSVRTANKILSAVRGTLKEAWRLGRMTSDDYLRAVDVEAVRGQPAPRRRRLPSYGEVLGMFRACAADERRAIGVRDAAVLALLLGGGFRRAELVALNVSDYDPGDGSLTVREGKGRKGRRLFAANGTKDALDAWLSARGRKAGPLLNPVTKDGAIRIADRLTAQSVYLIVGERGGQAGLKDFTPHDCRRWFASVLFESGADVLTVRQLLGHAKTDTTSLYDLRPEAARRKAVELLQVPYVSPKEEKA